MGEGTRPLVTLWGHLALNANDLVLAPFGAIIWPTSHEPFIVIGGPIHQWVLVV